MIAASAEAIWAVIEDPAALARVLPGAESVVRDGPTRFHGVMMSRIQFMTIRADITAELFDAIPPHHLRLDIEGRPRGLAGHFRVSVPFDLLPEGSRTDTKVQYSIDLTVSGRLAAFGEPILRETLRRQVEELVVNLGREVAQETGHAPT